MVSAKSVLLFLLFTLVSAGEWQLKSFPSNQTTRSFWVQRITTSAKLPVLILLHGGGGNARQIASHSGLDTLCLEKQVLLCCPQALDNRWQDGRFATSVEELTSMTSDLVFLNHLVEKLPAFGGDIDKISVAGISNGGMMGLRLACEGVPWLKSLSVIVSAMPSSLPPFCKPGPAFSALLVSGSKDPLVPFHGGEIRFGLKRLGQVLSARASLDWLLNRQGCDLKKNTHKTIDQFRSDGTKVEHYKWLCQNETKIEWFLVTDGGHTWPETKPNLPEILVGKTSREFNASSAVLQMIQGIEP